MRLPLVLAYFIAICLRFSIIIFTHLIFYIFKLFIYIINNSIACFVCL